MNQMIMPIRFHLFLHFLLVPFCLIVSSVHGSRDIAHYNVGAMVSSSDFTQGQRSFRVPHRSLNSMQESVYTKDANGENIILPLIEIGSGGNFKVTVGFGTPKRDFTLLFDTGSDASWIRCQTCVSGCEDQPTVYDPSKSQTSSNATCDIDGGCGFSVRYNDGSSSTGYYVNDTVSFTSDDSLPGFVFGCAQNIGGDFSDTSGVLGTGKGTFSLMAQTINSFYGLFCYCLPASDEGSKGFLVFGIQAYENCPIFDPNKMLSLGVNSTQDGVTQYLVKLIGITIGQKRLDMSLILGSSLDIMIDSGTVITRLPSQVYGDLKSEFKSIMSGYLVAEAWGMFDTCYNLDGVTNWASPQMVMHFENSVDLELDPSAVTVKNSDSQVCLAFVGNNDASELNIIGNQQLREHKVLLDTTNLKLDISVASSGCS